MADVTNPDGSVVVTITADDSAFRETLDDVSASVRRTAQGASQTAQEAVRAAADASRSASSAASAMEQVGSAASSASGSVSGAADALGSAGAAASGAAGSVSSAGAALSAVNSAAAAASSAVDAVAAASSSASSAMSGVSGAAGSAGSAVNGTASGTEAAASAAADYSAALSNLENLLTQCAGSLSTMETHLDETADGMRDTGDKSEKTDGILQKLGGTLKTVFSVALIKQFVSAIAEVGSEFEYTLDKVSTIADTTAVSVGEISDSIIALSDETGVHAADLNEAMYQAISAGVQTADAVDMVEIAVKSAKAGFTDATTAVDGLTTVLNAYKTANLEAGDVANKFLITQNLGKTSFGQLASAIGGVAPTANAAGVSIEELLAATASLTANGIETSQAMTGVKAALSNIITPSAQAKETAKQLGIEFNAAALKSKGLGGFMKELADAAEGDTEKMAQLFGSVEALNTMLTLTSEGGAELFDKAMAEMSSNTTALDDAYETMNDNLQTDLDVMKTNVENFGIDIYNSFSGGMRDVVQVVTGYVTRLREAMTSGGFTGLADELFSIAIDAVNRLGEGIVQALPVLVPEAAKAAFTVAETILDNVDSVIDTAEDIINALADALTSEETLSVIAEKTPVVVFRIIEVLYENILEIDKFAVDLCDRLADGIMAFDWGEAAGRMMENLADALEEAQKKVYVVLDNIFSGGSLYGGDVNNVVIRDTGGITGAIANQVNVMRDGIDDTVQLIEDAQDDLNRYRDAGQETIDDILGTDFSGKKTASGGQSFYGGNSLETFDDSLLKTAAVAEDTADAVADVSGSVAAVPEITAAAADNAEETFDDFKQWYSDLETLKAHGTITDDEFDRRLSEKLHSSAAYLDSEYNSYWNKITTANKKASESAADKISDDFKKQYDELERLLSLGGENGGISENEFYKRLAALLSQSEYRDSPAYNSYRNKLKSYTEREKTAAERASKSVSEEFKAWYDGQTLLLKKGTEHGGIDEATYYRNLEKMLESIPDAESNPAYASYWGAVKAFNEKQAKEAEKLRASVSEDFRNWYNEQRFLLEKGEITKDQYIENLREMLNGSEEYDQVQYKSYFKEVSDADEKALNEAEKKRLKTLKENAKDEISQLKQHISELQSEYKTALNKLIKERDSFRSKLSVNIFSTKEETITDSRTGQSYTKNTDTVADIQKKIEARKRLGTALQSLVKKGIPKGLLSELAGMDPDTALRFAEQLDALDNGKWENIVSSYNEYEEINRKIADDIYGPEIQNLNEKFADDLNGVLDNVSGEAAEKGAEMIRSFVSGMDMSSDDVVESVKKYADGVASMLSQAVSDGVLVNGELVLPFDENYGRDAGRDIAEGIADGIVDKAVLISTAVSKAIDDGLQRFYDMMDGAVGYRTAKTADHAAAAVPAYASDSHETTTQDGTAKIPDIIIDKIDLVLKDGRTIAELVNSENKKLAIRGGKI